MRPARSGFSLVELTIVVVILGVLAMLAVPRYNTAVERSVAAEAFSYLAQVQQAQAGVNARNGAYAKKLSGLSIDLPSPRHFRVGVFTSSNWEKSWRLRLTRMAPSHGFGSYSVIWGQNGFDAARSTIPARLVPAGNGIGGGAGSSTKSGDGSESSGGDGDRDHHDDHDSED